MNKKKQRKRERRVLDAARELALTMRMGLYTGDEITILTEKATANPETCESEAFLKFYEALDALGDKRYNKLLRSWATDGEVDPDYVTGEELVMAKPVPPADDDLAPWHVQTLAPELGISESTLRNFLRRTFPEAAPGKGGSWVLKREHVHRARMRYAR